jgi:hypothetical protein
MTRDLRRSPIWITSSRGEPGPVSKNQAPWWRGGHMSALGIGLLIVAHVADYTTFVVMVTRNGLDSELNPLVATIAEDYGLALLTMAKFATVLLVAAVFLIVTRTRPRVAATVLGFGVLVGAVGAFSNIATI